MSPRGKQETGSEFSPLTANTGVGYGSADNNGVSDGAESGPSLKEILQNGPSDLRSSMQSLRRLVDEHTGMFE